MAATMAAGSVYEEALDRIFTSWTLLSLAVDQGWGGRDSRAKRKQLQTEAAERLAEGSRRRRPPSHQNQDDVNELADWLYNRLWQLYNAEADDGSDEEVARILLRLHNTCRDGDVSFAQEFLQMCKPVDLDKCTGRECIEYATDEDLLVDGLQGMDIELDKVSEGGSDESMDEDGKDAPQGSGKGRGSTETEAASNAGEAETTAGYPKAPREEPTVDEDGFTSVVKGKRKTAR